MTFHIPRQGGQSIACETKECDLSSWHEWRLVRTWGKSPLSPTALWNPIQSMDDFSPYFNQKLRKCCGQSSSPPLTGWFGLARRFLWAALSAWDCTMPRWEYPWLGWGDGSTNFYMNSINARMLSVSCINLKQTVVKIGPLDGRPLFIDSVYRSPHSLILQLFPRLKTNASFITAVIETNIPYYWLMYMHHKSKTQVVFTIWVVNTVTFFVWWVAYEKIRLQF